MCPCVLFYYLFSLFHSNVLIAEYPPYSLQVVLQPVIRSLHFLLALDRRLGCDASLFDEVSHGVDFHFAFDDVLKERLFVLKVAWVELLLQAREDVSWGAVECTIRVRQCCWLRFVMQERLLTKVGIGGETW